MYEYNGIPFSVEDIQELATTEGYDDYLEYLKDNPQYQPKQKEEVEVEDKVEEPTEAEQLPGVGLDFQQGPAEESAVVGPENVAPEDMDLSSGDISLDSPGDVVVEEVEIKDPETIKKFPKFSSEDFNKTSNKIIAEQYQDLFLEDGFLFKADNNFITVTAPSGAEERFPTGTRINKKNPYSRRPSLPKYDQNERDITAQGKIDNFIKNNSNDEVSKAIKADQANLTQSFQGNIEDVAVNYAEENDVAFDIRYPLASLRDNPDAFAEVKKQLLNPNNQFFETGLSEAQQDVLYNRAFDSLVNTEANDLEIENLTVIQDLQNEGKYEATNIANKENHISTITNPREIATARNNAEIIKLQGQLGQTTAGTRKTKSSYC